MRARATSTWTRLVVVLAALAASSCSRTTELLPVPGAACIGTGAAVHLGAAADPGTCTGALAARFGRFALCSCGDLILPGGLSVVGPSGRHDPAPPDAPGPGAPAPRLFTAAVGTDGNLRVGQKSEVAGSLVTAGDGEATFVHGGHVQGNLRGGGGFATMTTMGLWVAGEMAAAGAVSGMFKVVGGPLRLPAGAAVAPEVEATSIVREAVAVAGPCACGAPAPELGAQIDERRTRNANAGLSFPANLLTDVQQPETLDFPCGEYYLPALRSTKGGTLELRVHGRAAIFVAGDVRLGTDLTVTLDDGAVLDLVVGGSFFMTGRVFGSPASPARTRLWVGGTTVSLPDQIQFGAAVYAPAAVFLAGANLSFSGSLYVGRLSVAGDVRIAYDPEITQAGAACGVAPPARVE